MSDNPKIIFLGSSGQAPEVDMSSLEAVGLWGLDAVAPSFIFQAVPEDVAQRSDAIFSLEDDFRMQYPDSTEYPFIDEAAIQDRVEEIDVGLSEEGQAWLERFAHEYVYGPK